MYANAVSQREGQLDNLSAAASGAHQNSLNSMFTNGLGLANGQAGVSGVYDKAAGDAQNEGLRSQIDLMLARQGVDQKTRQGQLDAIFNVGKTGAAIAA